MKPGEFIINNTSSFDIGAFIQSRPVLDTPKRRKEPHTISGRSGVLLFDEEAYDNTTMELLGYSLGDEQNTAAMNRERLYNMFDSSSYVDVEFYFDPLKRYRVDIEEPLSFESRYYYGEGQAWTATLSIKPFKYFKNVTPTILTGSASITNPHPLASLPVIKIVGSGNINLVVNGVTYAFKTVTDNIIIDSQLMYGYKEVGGIPQNENHKVYFRDFPFLKPGVNTISWSGTVTRLEIDPKWRSLT